MQNLITVSVDRSPQIPLAAAAVAKGLILQPATLTTGADSKSNQFPTPSPAEHLLPPELRSRFFPQEAWAALVATVPEQPNEKTAGTLLFSPIYATLYNLYLSQDAAGIEKTASNFLREHPIIPLDRYDLITQKLLRFFTQHGCDATIAEIRALYSSIGHDAVVRYLINAYVVADLIISHILAAHLLGTLGRMNYNLLQLLRALLIFSGMAPYFLPLPFNMDLAPPLKLFCALWNMRFYLPGWTFNIDPCAWNESDTKNDNPLQLKLAALTNYSEKVFGKQQAALATSGRGGDAKNLFADIPDCNPQTASDPDCDCCPENILCLPSDPCCNEINYYVTDLLVLREETSCYKPSDLAYIENVSPGETRARKHSLRKTMEEFTEEETKISKTEEKDLQVTDRFNLKAEIERNISNKLDVTAEVNGGGYKVTTAASLSMDVAQTEVRETFREAVDKAVSKIQVDSRKTHSLKVRTEDVETNKHRYENETALPFVSKYFWVSQIKKGQVFSYGLRGTVELLIPSPAMLYEHLEKLKSERGFKLKKPKHPCLDPTTIKPENYVSMIVKYNIPDLLPPPTQPAPQTLVKPVSGTGDRGTFSISPIVVDLADSFVATSMRFDGAVSMTHKGPGNFDNIIFAYGGESIFRQRNPGPSETEYKGIAELAVTVDSQATVTGTNLKDFSFTVKIITEKKIDYSEWQLAVYKAVMQKYETELQQYEEALAEYNRQKEENKFGRHPFAAKEIMFAEIKRAAIYMMCDESERDSVMNMRSEPCGYPEINRHAAGDKTKSWYFWDRAFDWDLMSFRFFDYFRNPGCSWPDKFDPADPNSLFNAFRRAGYVRVQIPVSPGMDEDVLWYINTHQEWGAGGQIPSGPTDDRWVSVIEEIKHSYKCYQNDREGDVVAIPNASEPSKTSKEVLLKGTDLYWNVFTASVDDDAIELDTEREIFIDGIGYRIIDIRLAPQSPPFDPSGASSMEWIITLERVFEGKIDGVYKHAIGAKYVGSPFYFELPTNLVWIGDYDNKCLPCYPLKPCKPETAAAN
jgi:ribosomal protein S9